MKGNNRYAQDEAIKASERAAHAVTTVVPNSATMRDSEGDRKRSIGCEQVQQSKLPTKVPGASPVAAMPPSTVLRPSISRDEEADRLLLKEREQHRASRIAVVPNLLHYVEDYPSTASSHFSPIGQKKSASWKIPAAATIPPPLAATKSAPVPQSAMHQQRQDEIVKQRERNARAAAFVPNLANRIGSIGTPNVDDPEPPVLQAAVSAPLPRIMTSTATMPRLSAHSAEDRNNHLRQQEKNWTTHRFMMTNAPQLTQQEKDVLHKDRERQAARLSLAPATATAAERGYGDGDGRRSNAGTTQVISRSLPDPKNLHQARYDAAAARMAMSRNLRAGDEDHLLKDRLRATTLQIYSKQHDKEGKTVLESGYSDMGGVHGTNRTEANVATDARRGSVAPGAMAVSDGIAQVLSKAVLTRVETTSPPSYVDPMDRDTFDGPRNQAVQPMDQQIPIESEPDLEAKNFMKKNDVESNTLNRRKWYMVGAVVLIMIIAIGVGVGLAVGGKSNANEAAAEGSSGPPSPAPALETERRIALREALVALGVSSLEQLTDPTEAQYQALTWLADVDTDTDIEDTLTMTQRYALAVYYYSMNGPAWMDSTNWLNPSTNVCEWRGITCLADESQISAITEREPINMEGELPTELDALPSLTKLFLEKNTVRGLAGPITVLTELALNEANLGEIFKDIPTTILAMTNLRVLSLSANGLTGTVPTEIEQLSSLVTLDLSSNSFSGTLPTQLSSLPSLLDISVEANQFSGDVFKLIEGISNLRVFIGTNNIFTGTIGEEIASLSNLETLQMRHNKLEGPFQNSIFNITSLAILDLGNNQLTGTLSSAIGELGNLVDLYLTDTLVSGSIPSEIGSLSRLHHWQAERCRMVGVIPTEFGLLPEMTHIQISNNDIEGTIPTELGNLQKLQYLYLEENSLTGLIPTQLGQLTSLIALRLVSNDLSGTLPSEICAISSLTKIILVDGFSQEGLSCGDCAICE